MVHEVMSIQKDTQESQWQPLSYWELKGYDIAKIERECPREDHPVLGSTFKLAIHTESEGTVVKDCEARITEMENDAMQRRSAAACAPGKPQLDLEMAIEVAEKKRKGPLSEEEKQLKKQLRQAEKQAELSRKVATASAAKLLPGLKAVLQKVTDKKDRMGASYNTLPDATQEQVTEVTTDLTETIAFATKLLDAAAKGKPLTETVPWGKEKELAAKIKAGNEAVRAIGDFLRAEKPAGKGRGRGKEQK